MGRLFLVELDGNSHCCISCNTSLALVEDVLSQSFRCLKGPAYLFDNVVNVSVGPEENRPMMSGMHTVADVYCCGCGQRLGWKYMQVCDKKQNYKEGKVVLERWRITGDSSDSDDVAVNQPPPRDSDFRRTVARLFVPIYNATPEERAHHLRVFMRELQPIARQLQETVPPANHD